MDLWKLCKIKICFDFRVYPKIKTNLHFKSFLCQFFCQSHVNFMPNGLLEIGHFLNMGLNPPLLGNDKKL